MNQRQLKIVKKSILNKDSSYHTLIDYTSRAKLYTYCDGWSELDFEGPVYVYQTVALPMHKMIIYNIKRKKHLIFDLDNLQYNIYDNLIVFKDKAIYGMYFYDHRDFYKMLELLNTIVNVGKLEQETVNTIKFNTDN